MATTILTKRSNTASAVPLAADLTNSSSGAELAVNTADKRLFTKDSGGTVVELGINPSSLTLSGGTANGVLYLNGSKVATSGSALTFDGTNYLNVTGLRIGGTDTTNTIYQATGALALSTGSTSPITFNVNVSEGMRLTSTGLGIGTSSPNGTLQLSRNASSGNWLVLDDTRSGYGDWAFYKVGANDLTIGYDTTAGSAPTQALTISYGGNLGLGVTPSAWSSNYKGFQMNGGALQAYTSGDRFAVNQNAFVNSGGVSAYVNNGYASQYLQLNSEHRFYTAASGTAGNTITFTQAMTLDSSGNLLVGTTSAFSSGKVCIQVANGSTQNGITIQDNASSGFGYVAFANGSGSTIGSINRVGTTSAVVYNTTSDYRLKTVTGNVTGQGERIDALKPINYLWTEGGQQARGFLAHEFQTVYPNSVSGSKDAVDADGNPVYQAMQASTAEVIADLIAEIQSLRVRVAQLESN